jgi:UDP-3-O-[3-hydroxymyristoyl] N-acetylglucosamine deacetylase
MDGLAFPLAAEGVTADVATPFQHTLKAAIGCVGVGLHSARRVRLTFHPAPADHGVVFRRTDLGVEISARFDRVADTRHCTVLEQDGVRVGTVEHVMAALLGCGIDNVRIDLDGPEPPIFDGSASQFVFLLDCAGKVMQDTPRRVVEVLRPVRVSDGDAFAELRPGVNEGANSLEMALSIDFAAAAIGRQALSLRLTSQSFRHELARARTFTLAEDVARLRATGLALGGSLDNAVVVDRARVLNPAGLRMPDEFVRHKLLDAVGDLALAGAFVTGRFIAHRSGHTLNNQLLRALFDDQAAWREQETGPISAAA